MQLPAGESEAASKARLGKAIDDYVHERLLMASRVLAAEAVAKVADGDAVLTFGLSATVLHILLLAHSVRRLLHREACWSTLRAMSRKCSKLR
jgi:translation initiation factor 2B subunit (eIF-2B alpha/beta/delta family)